MLSSEQERFNALVNASPMPTAIYKGREMYISSANQQMLDTWGKDKSVIGKLLRDALPELDGQPFHQLLQQVYQSGEAYRANEDRADLMVNGRLQSYYFTFVYQPIKDETGETIAIINTAVDVTELVNARKLVAETQERLSFALFSAEIGTWDLDLMNDKVVWDARCRELFGFPREGEILYEDVLSCVHPDDVLRLDQAVKQAVNPQKLGYYDIRYRTVGLENGQVRWVHCKGKAYVNEANLPYRFAGTAQDITADVKASVREEQLLSLVSQNADHMSVADLDGNMIYMNHSARQMLGIDDHADISCLNARDFYMPEELERVQKTIISQIDEQTGWQGTIHLMNKETKEVIPCHVNYLLIKDPESGKVIGRGATVRDLRPELKTRKILADQNKALESAVQELEFLADSVPVVVWTSQPSGQLDFINQRWYERSASSIEESLGNGWINTLHPEDLQNVNAAWQESLKTGNPYQIEFRLLDKNNQYRWWLVNALPLKDAEGNIIKWYGTNTDITQQKELSRQKDDFLGIASHELKTPVTSIKAYAQVMEMMFKRSGDKKNEELVAKMDKQVNRLNNLIGDLLDVTKLNTGRIQFDNSVFDFNQMVEEVIEDVQRTTSKHVIQKQLQFKRTMAGDRDRISQVVTNLLTNAIKYSPQANEIMIYSEDLGHEVQLCVQDYGIGISRDKKDKVFEQFYRVSGTKEYTFPGLGLGLYISSEIVKRLGGRIWVNSVEGKGSTFCFILPI